MPQIKCPKCDASIEVIEAFDRCRFCVPEYRILSFSCPQCDELSEIKVEAETVLIGGPDGFPEPCFQEDGRTQVSDISIEWQDYSATLRYAGREWAFGVTDFYREVNSPEYRAEFVRRSKEISERRHGRRGP